MKKYIIFLNFISCIGLYAQTTTQQKKFVSHKQAVVNFNSIKEDFAPSLLIREMPKPASEKMVYYNYPETKPNEYKKTNALLSDLLLGYNSAANPWGGGTPNDNDIAISNDGMIVSVVNTNIYMRNNTTNTVSPVKSLAAFTTPINSFHDEFDPKVLYDPVADRFILTCLVGRVDTNSKIIIGFSQTNDPTGNWNLYTLPGNPLNNSLWSDYPMWALSEKELFFSINLLYNDSSWQTGFNETIIWQIKKDSAYAGLPMSSVMHHNIKYNGKSLRNLCPAKGGSKLYTPNMFFVSSRNFASQNDSIFIAEVKDTIGSPLNGVTVKVSKSNQMYYMPPNGRQTIATQSLATNDARVLGAFYENNKIQYVQNTNNPANNHVTVYYGIIDNPQSASPIATGYIINNDTVDFAYPNISYAGLNSSDNTAVITFDHSSNKILPGISAIKADAQGNFSKVLRIKNGLKPINLLTDNLERWGDYSGSQRKYNNPGEIWMSGCYGYQYSIGFQNAHGAWIAQIGLFANNVSVNETNQKEEAPALLFPNPAQDFITVDFSIPQPEYLNFDLYDNQGKLVATLLRDWVKINTNSFQFSIRDLATGIYYLKITGNKGTAISKKVVKN